MQTTRIVCLTRVRSFGVAIAQLARDARRLSGEMVVTRFLTLLITLLLDSLAALHAAEPPQLAARIELLTSSWHFNAAQPALSTITAQSPQGEFAAPPNQGKGFLPRVPKNSVDDVCRLAIDCL